MKFFLHLSFQGTRYSGWQRQTNAMSVQEVLETVLSKVSGMPITCTACGRTDAGVHATQFFVHFVVTEDLHPEFVYRCNQTLPEDIAILELIPVEGTSNAMRDAITRRYTYHMHGVKDPFLSPYSAFYPVEKMDVALMQAAVALLIGKHDFKAFCKQPDQYPHTFCIVHSASLSYEEAGERIQFTITANRFIRNMIRLLVGNLLEVGYGRLSLVGFQSMLEKQQPAKCFHLAEAHGLYLTEVVYPYLQRPNVGVQFFKLGIRNK